MRRLPGSILHPIPRITHGARPETHYLVIHVNDGTVDGTLVWWNESGHEADGAQIEIGNDHVYQCADLDALCWHAGAANRMSIGIEHAGFGHWTAKDWLTNMATGLHLSANRAAWLLHEYGLGRPKYERNLFPHSFGGAAWGGHACPGDGFPWDHYLKMTTDAYMAHWGRK